MILYIQHAVCYIHNPMRIGQSKVKNFASNHSSNTQLSSFKCDQLKFRFWVLALGKQQRSYHLCWCPLFIVTIDPSRFTKRIT